MWWRKETKETKNKKTEHNLITNVRNLFKLKKRN